MFWVDSAVLIMYRLLIYLHSAEDAIAFMRRLSTPSNAAEVAEAPRDTESFDLYDEGSSPFFGGNIPSM